jgi:hypothetical protein
VALRLQPAEFTAPACESGHNRLPAPFFVNYGWPATELWPILFGFGKWGLFDEQGFQRSGTAHIRTATSACSCRRSGDNVFLICGIRSIGQPWCEL